METKVRKLFVEFQDPKLLAKIAKEVKDTSKERKVKRKGVESLEIRRGISQNVLDKIHKVMGNKHLEGVQMQRDLVFLL